MQDFCALVEVEERALVCLVGYVSGSVLVVLLLPLHQLARFLEHGECGLRVLLTQEVLAPLRARVHVKTPGLQEVDVVIRWRYDGSALLGSLAVLLLGCGRLWQQLVHSLVLWCMGWHLTD